MKKASTLEEVYEVFDHTRYLTEKEHEFYVDIYHNDLLKFATALKINKDNKKLFLIAGQSGNGKSSVLHNIKVSFPDKLADIEFHFIDGRDVFIYEDVDIIDILLMIGYRLIKDNETLKNKFLTKLEEIEDVNEGIKTIETINETSSNTDTKAKASISLKASLLSLFKSGIDFESAYKIQDEDRKRVRQLFKIRKSDLIELINYIIKQYKIEFKNDKKLIIVIDDLEKKSGIDDIFINSENLYFLKSIDIIKIITMPIYLKRENFLADVDVREFSLALKNRKKNKKEESYTLLNKVIDKRLEKKELITKEAKDMAVEFSGGNLRQLIRLINSAALEAITYEASKITAHEIKKAIDDIKRELSALAMPRLKFLEYIRDKHILDIEDEKHYQLLKESTKNGLVFAYFNGITWYDINPIVESIINEYKNF